MKYLVVGILILLMLAAGCVLSNVEIQKRTDAVAERLEAALAADLAGDEAGALALLQAAKAEWAAHEGVLASLLSHNYTDAVARDLTELDMLEGVERPRACRRVLRAVRALARMERPVWRNLF